MQFSVSIQQPEWQTVFVIPKSTVLIKGRRNSLYKAITAAAAAVSLRFGCYSWGNTSQIFYCGSFAQDYARGGFKSNLQGRVHNYLQNHRLRDTGRKNTNLMVFENINSALKQDDVVLRLFTFETIQIASATVAFTTYASDPDLVHAVEQLLIATHRRQGECQWNRT